MRYVYVVVRVREISDKNYLFRKREVSGFGIWNTEEFRVFVNQETKGRHIRENLLKVFASFFKTKRLNVMICEPSFHPYFQPGDKIFPTNSALANWDPGVGGADRGASGAGVSLLRDLFPVLQAVSAAGHLYGSQECVGRGDPALHAAWADHRHPAGDDHGILRIRIWTPFAGPENDCQTDSAGGDHWEGSLWRGVAWEVAGGERSRQNILLQGGAIVDPRGGDLSDGHAAS